GCARRDRGPGQGRGGGEDHGRCLVPSRRGRPPSRRGGRYGRCRARGRRRGRRGGRRCDRTAAGTQGPRLLPGRAIHRPPGPGRPVQCPVAACRCRCCRAWGGFMSRPTAVLLIAHSAQLAAGAAEVAAQMAPDVLVRAAGGTEDGRIGTSDDRVDQALSGLLDDAAEEIVLLTDLGSATLTAESVLEMREDDRLRLADGPFVEGAVAAAVAAQGGAKAGGVAGAAEHAADSFAGQEAPGQRDAGEQSEDTSQVAAGPALGADVVTRSLELRNSLGLHARPAAQLARKMDGFDATVRINGVDATSVLALMGLGLTGGARLQVEASGPEATDALDVLEADVEAGFGEE